MPSATTFRLPVVRLVCSTNAEEYTIIEVTGASSGSRVRELIFSKLKIPVDNNHAFFVYPSEIGSFALGAALTDRQLFSLCAEQGDPTGSLKFFVSTYPNSAPNQIDPGYLSERVPPSIARR
ncbi:hypothetical protein DFP72DRAFT_127140 [Ephemerocybe angulata]|uniref:Uncharacterized protein n=1 Tax=Ephemerocybe angulata TaxID=980116 RepID=A0A8H6LVA7_9AGAR|nr:hypothetical protein DFP72DRAFT_127140 [Tulosesus angulatus]